MSVLKYFHIVQILGSSASCLYYFVTFTDGKKVCWNFRKGRCRFGSKCTFAHDSDVKQKPAEDNSESIEKEKRKQSFFNSAPPPENDNSEAVIENNKKSTKKRPGLAQGLVPSKKAMKFHEKVYGNE